MSASCVQRYTYKGQRLIIEDSCTDNMPVTKSFFHTFSFLLDNIGFIGSFIVIEIIPERSVLFYRLSGYHRKVFFPHLSFLEKLLKPCTCISGSSKHTYASGALVEAVNRKKSAAQLLLKHIGQSWRFGQRTDGFAAD
nr:hypothetical protein [Aristaeella hokkaidonensis]